MSKLIRLYLFFHCVSTFVRCEGTLEEQNTQNDLHPVNDDVNNDERERDHEKRTIFNSEVENYGWAKHVGVHPSGFRYVLGIGPVDLKYVPVIRNPFRVTNHRPRWPSKVFKPVRPFKPVHEHFWKPMKPLTVNPGLSIRPLVPLMRPVVPLVRPFGKPVFRPVAVSNHHWPNKSWQHDEWKQKPTPPKPVVGLTPVNVVPVVKPLSPPQAAPVVPVNPVVPLQPVNPIVSIQHVHPAVPVNQVVPVQSVNPVIQVQPSAPPALPFPSTISTDPWVPLVKPAYPFGQQQPFFEVTKPNLPVLPLGASFPSPVLQPAQTGPTVIHQRPQLVHQHPGAVVEFHGNHHHFISPNGYINFPKLASIQPQYAPNFVQTLPQNNPTQVFSTGVQIQQGPQLFQSSFDAGQPVHQAIPQVTQVQQLPQHDAHYNPQVTQVQQLPQQDAHYNPQVTQVQQLPQPDQQYTPQLTQIQQYPPLEQQYIQQVTQFQQLPNQGQVNQVQQVSNQGQQVVDEQYLPPSAHGQLPLEGENSQQQQQNQYISNSQSDFFFQGQDQQYINQNDLQQQLQTSNSIQPGQTDVQTPLYLPPHYTYNPQVETFNNAFSSQFVSNQDADLRPSPQLEPPYNNLGFNRREDVSEEETEDSSDEST